MKNEDCVIQLHNIARLIDAEYGSGDKSQGGQLAPDIRAVADKLAALIKKSEDS
jgi:hypothetical protein